MTIVVRALIWPLHKKSYMAMKRMSLVQPEMAKLKDCLLYTSRCV